MAALEEERTAAMAAAQRQVHALPSRRWAQQPCHRLYSHAASRATLPTSNDSYLRRSIGQAIVPQCFDGARSTVTGPARCAQVADQAAQLLAEQARQEALRQQLTQAQVTPDVAAHMFRSRYS